MFHIHVFKKDESNEIMTVNVNSAYAAKNALDNIRVMIPMILTDDMEVDETIMVSFSRLYNGRVVMTFKFFNL